LVSVQAASAKATFGIKGVNYLVDLIDVGLLLWLEQCGIGATGVEKVEFVLEGRAFADEDLVGLFVVPGV